MSVKLSHILKELDGIAEVRGTGDAEVMGVSCDSRHVKPGDIFVALTGTRQDGRQYIPQAIAAGAAVIVAEGLAESGDAAIPVVQVKDSANALGAVADIFFGHPSAALKVAGVTGTNGKTTTAYILQHLMKGAWLRAGLLGTIVQDDGIDRVMAERTTPQANEIHSLMAAMLNNGCRGVAMEVSSHGLEQKRVAGLQFDVGIFTNLTQDHLDYHRTMEAYYDAKARLPEILASQKVKGGKPGVMVINTDDVHGARMAKEFEKRIKILTYGVGARADYRILRVETGMRGTRFGLSAKGREFLVKMPLFGRFNIHNAVAALAAADALGMNFREAVTNLEDAPQVPGRLESVVEHRPYRIFVDYAHTPDALKNVLETLRQLKPAKIITVVGCGGDRDPGKRPQMGRIASDMSDICIFTSDNPRSEDPAQILQEMVAGVKGRAFRVNADRAQAIQIAVKAAEKNDIVLIAGKGHETYQEIAGEKHPFDDREMARRADRDRAKEGGEE